MSRARLTDRPQNVSMKDRARAMAMLRWSNPDTPRGGRQPDATKLAARESGLPKFLGSPCKRGHDGIRYSRTGHCVACANFNRNNKEIGK